MIDWWVQFLWENFRNLAGKYNKRDFPFKSFTLLIFYGNTIFQNNWPLKTWNWTSLKIFLRKIINHNCYNSDLWIIPVINIKKIQLVWFVFVLMVERRSWVMIKQEQFCIVWFSHLSFTSSIENTTVSSKNYKKTRPNLQLHTLLQGKIEISWVFPKC